MARKPLTPAQKLKKQARDRRYREAHKEEINRKARERRQQRSTAKGRRAELESLFRETEFTWFYSGGKAGFWRSVAAAEEAGATHMDIVKHLRRQISYIRRYRSTSFPDEGDTTGMDFWEQRDDRFADDEWYYYHGVFG